MENIKKINNELLEGKNVLELSGSEVVSNKTFFRFF